MTSSKLLPLAALAVPLFSQVLQPYEAVEPHMGTLFRIKLYAKDETAAKQAFEAAFARIAALDSELSDYKPDSELSRATALAAGHPVRISDDLFRVLSAARERSVETGGAFDVTIGPLTHLWRAARKDGRLPDAQSVEQARAKCGYGKMHLDTHEQTVRFDEGGMELDVGAIAKGDAADQALLELTRHGVGSGLVAASGDLAFSDPPPGEAGWKIGVDAADRADAPFTRVLMLRNAAISTSGAAEQHLDQGSVRYSHVIDPKQGSGLTQNISATVIARQGIEADSLSTAIEVLGPERGLALVDRRPGAAALIVADGCVRESASFGRLGKKSASK